MSISHATWSMCWKRHPWPQSVIMLNVLNSGQFGWKTSRAIPKWSQEWCCSSLFPWSQSWTSAGVGNVWATLLMEVFSVLSPLSPAGAYLWSWNLCLAVQGSAGVSDCPKVPEVLQDCQIVPKPLTCSGYLELTHWDSIMHHSEHPELKLSLLDRSKVWSREVLNLIQHQPKRYVCSLVFAVTKRWLRNYSQEMKKKKVCFFGCCKVQSLNSTVLPFSSGCSMFPSLLC